MTDPLDFTVPKTRGPFVLDVGLHGLVIPSAEAELGPLWRTEEELNAGKDLIQRIELALETVDFE